jgi:hypothetical protein
MRIAVLADTHASRLESVPSKIAATESFGVLAIDDGVVNGEIVRSS